MSSCDSISSEIAALRADIAALNNKYALKSELDQFIKKDDRPRIIQQSVASAEQLIIPAVMALVASKIAEAIGPIKILLAKFMPLLQLIGVIAQLLTLAAAAGALLALGTRMDALENGLISLGNDVSRNLGLTSQIKKIALDAQSLANQAINDVRDLKSLINILEGKLRQLIYDAVKILEIKINDLDAHECPTSRHPDHSANHSYPVGIVFA
jgi:hypothetical protein